MADREMDIINVDTCHDYNATKLFENNERINVSLVQLELPLGKHLFIEPVPGKAQYTFIWHNVEVYKKKICTILDNIVLKCRGTTPYPHIIVFPEYTIPFEIVESLKQYSEDFSIIIAGSHFDEKTRKNFCPIIIQGEPDPIFIEKNELSDEENNYCLNSGDLNKSFFHIHWKTKSGDVLVIHICICHDYLTHHCRIVEAEKRVTRNDEKIAGGAIIVPMCSTSMDPFLGAQAFDVPRKRFVLLCSAITPKIKTYVGGTAIYGADKEVKKRKKDSEDKGSMEIAVGASLYLPYVGQKSFYAQSYEGVICASLDIAHPNLSNPALTGERNPIPIYNKHTYYFNNNLKALQDDPNLNKKQIIGVINPTLYNHFGKKLMLYLFKVKPTIDFSQIVPKNCNQDFDACFIYGKYDIVVKRFETEGNIRDKHIKSVFAPNAQDHDFKPYEVKEIIKFYGKIPSTINYTDFEKMKPEKLERFNELLRSLGVNGWDKKEYDELKEDYPNSALILGKYPKEEIRKKCVLKAVIKLEIKSSDNSGDLSDADSDRIKKEIINEYLLKHDSVISIFKFGEEHSSLHYIIEVLGKPPEIFHLLDTLCMKPKDSGITIDIVPLTHVVSKSLCEGLFLVPAIDSVCQISTHEK